MTGFSGIALGVTRTAYHRKLKPFVLRSIENTENYANCMGLSVIHVYDIMTKYNRYV